jgi:hypothetical protein
MPSLLRAAWLRWKALAEAVGHFQARVLFGFLYFLVAGPFAIGLKLFSDPLQLKTDRVGSLWNDFRRQTLRLEDARRQF